MPDAPRLPFPPGVDFDFSQATLIFRLSPPKASPLPKLTNRLTPDERKEVVRQRRARQRRFMQAFARWLRAHPDPEEKE